MDSNQGSGRAKNLGDLTGRKSQGQKFSVVTCYDAAFARLIQGTEVDLILVGDSLGNVILGYETTIPVTVDDMVHHTAAVTRGSKGVLVCADMPFFSYQASTEQALTSAGRLVQEGGAHCVKLEGGQGISSQVAAIVDAGVPVIGHLGFTPQSIHRFGGYRVQGRGESQARILEDARALEQAGASAVVLEMVPSSLAARIEDALQIPTIGIGAGPSCTGQVLVLHDLLGFNEQFNPRFLKKYANVGTIVSEALSSFDREVKGGVFPSDEHVYPETT